MDRSCVDASVQVPLRNLTSPCAGAEMLSKDAFCNDYDFRMRGVIPIIVGFPSISSSAASTSTTSPRQSHHSPKPTSRTLISDIHRSIRRGDEAQTKNAAYLAAATALVAKRRMDGTFAISSSAFAAQRKLALSVCGSDWEEDFEVVCAR